MRGSVLQAESLPFPWTKEEDDGRALLNETAMKTHSVTHYCTWCRLYMYLNN